MTIGELKFYLRGLCDSTDISVVSNEPGDNLQVVTKDNEIIFYIGPLDLETVDTDEFFEN